MYYDSIRFDQHDGILQILESIFSFLTLHKQHAFARKYTRALTLACLMSEGASVHCFTLSKLNCLRLCCFAQS